MLMFEMDNDAAIDTLFQLINTIDMYYQQLSVRVSLFAWQLWQENKILVSSNQRRTLQEFLLHSQSSMTKPGGDISILLR